MNFNEIVNFGRYYTPLEYVELASAWLHQEKIDSSWTIFDPSSGVGSFIRLSKTFSKNKFIANDIDSEAISLLKSYFPFTMVFNKNVFENYKRSDYKINEEEKLIIVGNPPYNDTTSQIRKDIKQSQFAMAEEVKTNDLGLSSLLCYEKLKADYVLILTPLSYLIKKKNFQTASKFFSNYKIIKSIVFSSDCFDKTSKKIPFPIVMALYKRSFNNGTSYEEILNYKFLTTENKSFSVSVRDYIGNFIDKYPNNNRYKPEILFYTMRDINALKRSRTFIKDRIANAVDINPSLLSYYAYVDCFKRFESCPYYMGNFDIPLIAEDFKNIELECLKVSAFFHREIKALNNYDRATKSDIDKVRNYINEVILFDSLIV